MSWLNKLKQLLGKEEQDWRYVVATLQSPRSPDAIDDITRFWASREFCAIANDPGRRALLLSDLQWDRSTLEGAIQLADLQLFEHFPLAGFLVKASNLDQLSHLPRIEHIYEVPNDCGLDYIRIIKGLHYVIEHNEGDMKRKISVVNMSLQPLDPYPFEEKEAMNVATRILAEHGIVVVIAAGNFGPEINTLNPWSVAPWVIGVGATHPDGKRLWNGSSRGIPQDPLYHPTVVAPGVEDISWRVPSSIYPVADAEGKYEVATGTSFAAPKIAGIAARCLEFMQALDKSKAVVEWKQTVETEIGLATRPITDSPQTVKKMIEDMAVSLTGYEIHEVGEGLVDNDIATQYFNSFRLSSFINVFALRKEDTGNALQYSQD